MEDKSGENLMRALEAFACCVGLPDLLVSDGASEIGGRKTKTRRFMSKHHIKFQATEAKKQKHNKAEAAIRIIKSRTK